jgi:hypothetical protein
MKDGRGRWSGAEVSRLLPAPPTANQLSFLSLVEFARLPLKELMTDAFRLNPHRQAVVTVPTSKNS